MKKTSNRIKNMKKYEPSGDWRKIIQLKINYTYMIKNWWYNYDLLCKKVMLKTLEKLFSHLKFYQLYKVIADNNFRGH